ncbi:MAG: hypothetical protein AB1485_07570, partial [Candidatus Thermoplasmatota archaeon]
ALIIFALALSVFFASCIKIQSPLTARPKVIIDYADRNVKIYVQGQELRRYNRMEIKINETIAVNESNVCGIAYSTNLTEFTLNVTVVDVKDIYRYDCSIKIEEDGILKIATDEKIEEIKIKELPTERIMAKE